MGEFGNIAGTGTAEGIEQFFPEEQNQNKDKGKRYLPFVEIGKRSKEYHHEDHPACAKKAGRKEEQIEYAGNQGGDKDHEKKRNRTVNLFQNGTDEEDKRKI